ncbi:MAG: dihydroneopterin aldolase [Bacteroidota bacterium]|nr:dihydroneopterin aldolase [Bacteroidota bacterium]
MGRIILNNIRVYAYHGCMEEEAKIGSEYSVDLEVKASLVKSAKSDNLHDTVDYVLLNAIVKQEMAIRSQLLEHVANRIIDRIMKECTKVERVKLKVAKINPPIEGDVQDVSVVMKKKRKK